jgi:hypothetical protein
LEGFDMMIDTHRTVEIEASPIRMLGLAALGLVVTAVCAVLVVPGVAPGRELIGYVSVAFFGALTLVHLWRTITIRGPVITISPEGIRDTRVAADLIPWSAINDISICQYRNQRIMVLAVDPTVEAGLRLTRIARWTRGANRSLGVDGLCVMTPELKIGFDELLTTTQAYAQASRSRGSIATTPAGTRQ